jgi:hypothetical protein
MKANELRIGNIIKQGKITFLELRENEIICIKCDGNIIKDPEPLILTEEILLNCGFEKSSEYIFDYKDYNNIVFDAPNNWTETSDYPTGIDVSKNVFGYNPVLVIIRCLFLHQLQNKFFEITEKELKVNLKSWKQLN